MLSLGYDVNRVWGPVARRLASDAEWYAYGRIDAGTPDLAGASLEMGNAFGNWYGDLAERHESERSVYRPAMILEWERFSTAGRIPAGVFVMATEYTQLVPSEQNWREHTECDGWDSQEFAWHCHSHQVYGQKY